MRSPERDLARLDRIEVRRAAERAAAGYDAAAACTARSGAGWPSAWR
jgi:hypothetical protein